jgi:hypothetical protein
MTLREEKELFVVILIVGSLLISYYVLATSPDPTRYPVTPTWLWEICNTYFRLMLLLCMTWPASIPIWFYSMLFIVDCLINSVPIEIVETPKFDVEEYLASKGLTMETYLKTKEATIKHLKK